MVARKVFPIDLNKPRKNVLHCMQNDVTRAVDVLLYLDGKPYDVYSDVDTGVTVEFSVSFILPNGFGDNYTETSLGWVACAQDLTQKNLYHVNIDDIITSLPGFAELIVKFASTDGQVLHAFPLTIDVGRTVGNDIDPSGDGPIASRYLRRDVQAAKTSGMTQSVGVDDNGKLWTTPGGGGGGSDLPELQIGDMGKVLMAVDSGEDDPIWGKAFQTPIRFTISQSGTSYTVPVGTYTMLVQAISDNRLVEAVTPYGIARYCDDQGTSTNHVFVFEVNEDANDVIYSHRFVILSTNAVSYIMFNIDNSLVTLENIGAARAVTVTTITDSSYQLAPVANYAYVFSNPVLALEITASYATSGDWSVEFDAPSNVAPSVTLPSALKTVPASPSFSANHHYEINCHNGYAIVAEW